VCRSPGNAALGLVIGEHPVGRHVEETGLLD
jgi:hypothetical protein